MDKHALEKQMDLEAGDRQNIMGKKDHERKVEEDKLYSELEEIEA